MTEVHPPNGTGGVLALAQRELARLLGAGVLLAVASAVALAVPLIVGVVIDAAVASAPRSELRRLVGVLLLLFATMGLLGYAGGALLARAGAGLLRDLRAGVLRHLLGLSAGFYDERRIGELLSRIGTDVMVVQVALTRELPAGVQAALRCAGALTILLVLQPRSALVVLAVVPPVLVLALLLGRRLEDSARAARDATAEVLALADESLAGIRTIQAAGAEPTVLRRFAARLQASFEVDRRSARLQAAFTTASTTAALAAFAIVLGYGGEFVLSGRMSAGELTSVLLYTFAVATSIGGLGKLYGGLRELRGAGARMVGLLAIRPLVEDPASRVPPPEPFVARHMDVGPELVFTDVHLCFRGAAREALSGFSLTAAPGSVVALVGPSGAGKSSVFALLLRFYRADSGSITIDGRDLDGIAHAELRRMIACVPQEVFLFDGTVADNLRLAAPVATETELWSALSAAGADGFVRALADGLETELGERGVRLSAGERQRLAIARAFVADPRVLLLDEATSALDADAEAAVGAALARLQAGRTTLVIAHRLATARRADVIHVLAEGRVVASGTHATLYAANGIYRRYWSLQSMATEA